MGWSSLAFLFAALNVSGCAEATYSDDEASLEAGVGAVSDDTAAAADETSAAPDDAQDDTTPGNVDPAPGTGTNPTTTGPEAADDDSVEPDAGDLFGGAPTIIVGPDPMPTSSGMPMDVDPDNDPPIVHCDGAVAAGDAPMIDDFEDGDENPLELEGRSASWYKYNSDDGSDAQLFAVEPIEASPAGGEFAMHTAGSGFQWAGIGLGLRWSEGDLNCAYDASVYDGVTFWGRGSGSVRFTAAVPETIPIPNGGTCDELQSSCWNNPGSVVTFSGEWQQYVLPFAEMSQDSGDLFLDPTKIRTFQFEAGDLGFDFVIDGFSFYSASHPPPAAIVTEPNPVDPDPVAPDGGSPEPVTPDDPADASVNPEQPETPQDAGVLDGGTR